MAYDPEKVAQLKHIGSLASAINTTINTLDGKKFGDAAIADGKLKFFAKVGDTTAIKELDLPEEIFLDQMQTNFVQNFVFSAATYPGATNPNLDGKPVLVLAVKGDKATNPTLTYSFVNLEKLIDTYTAGNAGISISGYSIAVNVSTVTGNVLELKEDGLFASANVAGATQGNIAIFGASGAIVDSGSKFATDAEVAELINQYFPTVQGGNG